MLNILKSLIDWMFGSKPRPSSIDSSPFPTVEFDEEGFRLQFVDDFDPKTSWSDVIEVWVLIFAGEAWWSMHSAERELAAPTSAVGGGDAFTRRVRSLPGFDDEAFLAAMRVEQKAEEGEWGDDDPDEFLCWRNPEVAATKTTELTPTADCDACSGLNLRWPIRSPKDLRKAVRVALDNLGDDTLEESKKGRSLSSDAPKLLNPSEPWLDDYLEYRFACTECGATYTLTCETYHGSGGEWAPADID